MIADRDYVYVFGPEWADELLDAIKRDPLAQNMMAEYELTCDDLRSYYLAQPHFDRVYQQLLDSGDDFVNDPVDTLLRAVKAEKELAIATSAPKPRRDIGHQRIPLARKMPAAGAVRNSVALFVRLLMS